MDQEPKLTGAPNGAREPQIIIVREKADGADYKLIAIVALLLASPVILFFGLPFMAVAFVTMESWLPFFLVGLLAVSLVPVLRERLNNQVLVKDLEGRINKLEAELSEARHALILMDEANEFHSKLQLESKKQPEQGAQSLAPSESTDAGGTDLQS